MKNTEEKNRFIELRAKGLSFDKIAKELNVSKQTLINWSREYELQIKNLKAIELEALQEKYFIQKEARIEFFGELLKKAKDEISKRDLKEIPTEKLLDIILKLNDVLKKEETPVEFTERFEVDTMIDLSKLDFSKGIETVKWKP